MSVEENLRQVRLKIAKAAEQAGRKPEEVKLLAVSKTMGADKVQEAYRAGQKVFAENRVQEWQEKAPVLPEDCEWHLIGRLQTNKVKYLNSSITLIHSLDRMSLLETLETQGEKRGMIWPVLLQVNTARDPHKTGLMKEEVNDFLEILLRCPHIRVQGLMTIGALDASVRETRDFFRELRLIRDDLQRKYGPQVSLKELSMGMSQDFELAIAEGATMVRIGRQIFGERSKQGEI